MISKSWNWSINDITTPEGAQINPITSLYGMKQLILERTHILQHSSSCIDLFFTNQPNIAIDSGLGSSLHPKCHHQIIYSILNSKIWYSFPYIRKILNYNSAETDLINRTIKNCDWPSLFLETDFLGKNIFHNYIPNKITLYNGKDPPWINEEIKSLIDRKNYLYQRQRNWLHWLQIFKCSYTRYIKSYFFFRIEIAWTSC